MRGTLIEARDRQLVSPSDRRRISDVARSLQGLSRLPSATGTGTADSPARPARFRAPNSGPRAMASGRSAHAHSGPLRPRPSRAPERPGPLAPRRTLTRPSGARLPRRTRRAPRGPARQSRVPPPPGTEADLRRTRTRARGCPPRRPLPPSGPRGRGPRWSHLEEVGFDPGWNFRSGSRPSARSLGRYQTQRIRGLGQPTRTAERAPQRREADHAPGLVKVNPRRDPRPRHSPGAAGPADPVGDAGAAREDAAGGTRAPAAGGDSGRAPRLS